MAFDTLLFSFCRTVSAYLFLPFFRFFFSISRVRRNVDWESVPPEASNKSEITELLTRKFKFPTFEEFRRIQPGRTVNNSLDEEFLLKTISASRAAIDEPAKNGRKPLSKMADEEFPGIQACPDEPSMSSSDKNIESRDWKSKKSLPGFEENEEDSNGYKTGKSSMEETTTELETLWEHQELIEQLKMELRKVRATGLPTILEESDSSPRAITGVALKPWKIEDESFKYEDCVDEVEKFYKAYIETMRKFDILNYQKMYAIGFLQLKDPFRPSVQQKGSPSTLKSFVSKNLWIFKHKQQGHNPDPAGAFVGELQEDLEVVYVGQVCLSWEFLRWQYMKVVDLWNVDPHGIRQYNEVAGELQRFQVLVQRFVEDEPFQGPRVQSYVKSRCVLRNLLQVPAIREDNPKDKNMDNTSVHTNNRDEYFVTTEMLVEIVEESIRTLWVFVRTDKDCNTLPTNGRKKKTTAKLHNPQDHKLLSEVEKNLRKKERKLKDIVRSEKCILRRLQYSDIREDGGGRDSNQVLNLFFAEVEMKLVCRVLNMSKISRDQLIWCRNKLRAITFVSRKIYIEPGFLLFPQP
ncbi:uncharacterized protein LOC127241972 isoform X1 [Andrographis paniculata]|uniref:uncharacterized protein LOC127241972 isoform X1 n=1 Tax=Andrographis paniculata TaxID=175694 RepID=UPI0021E88091|nr:uncharacterized protein LOC127241972 isoform X1 [Andrographis paniculata]